MASTRGMLRFHCPIEGASGRVVNSYHHVRIKRDAHRIRYDGVSCRLGVAAMAVALALAACGCTGTPAPQHAVSARSPASVAPSTAPSSSSSPAVNTLSTRLFGPVSFTARPRAVVDPLETASPPVYQNDRFAWYPRQTVADWVRAFDAGTLAFRPSLQEAEALLPSLVGATVADVGAGKGNNLRAWKAALGPAGRLVEVDVDVNAVGFMAYAARKSGMGKVTMVVHSVYENPCLPVGQFDLVLCSQMHNHINLGPWPRNARNEHIFRAQSRVFLGALRDALKDDRSLFVVIDGFQDFHHDPRQLYLEPKDAIRNIESNGFTLVKQTANAHCWVASFRRSTPSDTSQP